MPTAAQFDNLAGIGGLTARLTAAGAGSGVYNTTRQIGAVLGSAAIAVLIQARLTAELPAAPGKPGLEPPA